MSATDRLSHARSHQRVADRWNSVRRILKALWRRAARCKCNYTAVPAGAAKRAALHRKRCVNSEVIDCEKSLLTECSSATVAAAGHSRNSKVRLDPRRCRRFRVIGATRRDAMHASSIVRRSLILLRVDPRGPRGFHSVYNFRKWRVNSSVRAPAQCGRDWRSGLRRLKVITRSRDHNRRRSFNASECGRSER